MRAELFTLPIACAQRIKSQFNRLSLASCLVAQGGAGGTGAISCWCWLLLLLRRREVVVLLLVWLVLLLLLQFAAAQQCHAADSHCSVTSCGWCWQRSTSARPTHSGKISGTTPRNNHKRGTGRPPHAV